MKSLFITGASGFLGSKILERIRPEEYESITLLGRRMPVLPDQLRSATNISVVQGSLADVDLYGSSLSQNTYIVHLAAITGKADPEDYYSVNTEGTRLLSEAARKAGVSGILFVSSIAVSFPDRKGYLYADSKEKAERIVQDSGLAYCIVRPTIILGDGSPIWNSFYKLAQSSTIVLPGNGKTRIQPIHVEDMASLIRSILSSQRFRNETLELGGPEVVSMEDFVCRIHRASKGGKPKVLHLPLGFIVMFLRAIEKVNRNLLPVNSGQFASFKNDGVAVPNDLWEASRAGMQDIDTMLKEFTEKMDHGQH